MVLCQKWGGQENVCNNVPSRGVWGYAPPENFLNVRRSENASDAFSGHSWFFQGGGNSSPRGGEYPPLPPPEKNPALSFYDFSSSLSHSLSLFLIILSSIPLSLPSKKRFQGSQSKIFRDYSTVSFCTITFSLPYMYIHVSIYMYVYNSMQIIQILYFNVI